MPREIGEGEIALPNANADDDFLAEAVHNSFRRQRIARPNLI